MRQILSATLCFCMASLLPGLAIGQEPSKDAGSKHSYFSKTEHRHAAKWSYLGDTGPTHWGDLSKAYILAKTGKHQSPINIPANRSATKDLPELKFEYQKEWLVVVNNGHTIQHNERPGSFLHIGDKKYALEQFHVHTPSEHTIEGKQYGGEIHFVHKSSAGEIAVVAVLVKNDITGRSKLPPLQIPSLSGGKTVAYRGFHNPAVMFPEDKEYFEYQGSFTTPPCTEGVRWIVLTTPISVDHRNLEHFHKVLGNNNRPTQPLNDRVVRISKTSAD